MQLIMVIMIIICNLEITLEHILLVTVISNLCMIGDEWIKKDQSAASNHDFY